MQHNLHPCIWYNGNAKEAAGFYCSVFPNGKITTDLPMLVNFELEGLQFMGLNGGPQFKPNASISFFIICETMEEINSYWDRLSEGGTVMMPLDKYDWSERYGFLTDKFGLAWQLMKGGLNDVKQKIAPGFLFVGNQFGKAKEAVELYSQLFPGSAIEGMLLYTEQDGEALSGAVKHAQFTLDGNVFMAMDGFGQHEFHFNEGISFVVNCNTQAEIDLFWNKLTADGGAESMCGWLKDRFGVSWQIIPAKLGELMMDKDKEGRAMQAMMKMKKPDIAALENA